MSTSVRDAFYHVFLSFRGETRDKFTCFLYEALKAQGYVAFMDKSNIHVGDQVDSTIKEGIRYSFSAIIIFSQNYAYSTWCLDELVLILQEKKKSSTYFIIPIFYDVKPQDLKHQLGDYGSALEKHRKRHGDKVEEWKQALVEVGNILGVHVEGQQDAFIRSVVKLFRETVDAKFPKLQVPLKSSKRETSKDKVILYTTNASNGLRRTKWIKKLLASGNVVFEERNCSKDVTYYLELPGHEVKFPTVIVNGKDLCEGGVEGLDDFKHKHEVVLMLKTIYGGKSVSRFVGERFKETEQLLDTGVDKVVDFFSS